MAYTRLKYIESNGTQYIDTNYYPTTENLRVITDFEYTASYTNKSLYGSQKAGSLVFSILPHSGFFLVGSSGNSYLTTSYVIGTRHLLDVQADNGLLTVSFDGSTRTANYVSPLYKDNTLYLFASHNGSKAAEFSSCKMFSCQIYDNETLVRDYVPMANEKGVCGLYDNVNSVFYPSANGNNFFGVRDDNGLPVGYSLCEYIESNGTQYIDVGFKPNNNTKVDIGVLSTQREGDYVWLFGCQDSLEKNGFAVSTWTAEFGSSSTTKGINIYDGIKHDVSFDKGVLSLDGSVIWSSSGSFQTNYNLSIAAINSAGVNSGFNGKIYYCRVYDNGTLIRDFVPVVDNNGMCGLWDKANDTFYKSPNGNNFIGYIEGQELPIGFTKCEYIESNGTQYIDVGFKPNNNTKIDMSASLFNVEGDQYFYGSKDSSSQKSYICAFSKPDSMTVGYGAQFLTATISLSEGEVVNIVQDKNVLYVNGTILSTAADVTFQTPSTLYLCARNNNDTLSKLTRLKIYSCRLYDNGTLIRDYIPCQNSEGVYGLYDLANNVFYQSATSYGFTGKWIEDKKLLVSLSEFRKRLMMLAVTEKKT